MGDIILHLDLGRLQKDAKSYKRDNPDTLLSDFIKGYKPKFLKRDYPSEEKLKMPLKRFEFQFIAISEPDIEEEPACNLGEEFEALSNKEQDKKSKISFSNKNIEEKFPESVTDNEAIRVAYKIEMSAITDYLKNGLSVLVVCDKIITEYIYDYVCEEAGRKVKTDAEMPGRQGPSAQTLGALQGQTPSNPADNLRYLVRNLKDLEVLVIRSLDMLDNPQMIEILYQRTSHGKKAQILAFLDPSLEVKKVLSDRFAVHVSITGLSRYIKDENGNICYTVSRLMTSKERACFKRYEPENLYKNVAGLNAIQFRDAMQYIGSIVAAGTEPGKIFDEIRKFKKSSSGEIEIPKTKWKDIGGYEDIKQQLMRTLALIAGSVKGLDDEKRADLIPRGFIFYGPPGTGKTLFAKAIANEMNATIQMISGPEIMNKYVGQSENNLRRIFNTARRNAPSVIFFDEFDSIATKRSSSEESDGGARANNAVVAQLLTEIDGFNTDRTVLVIGTTNREDIIDEALLRPSRLKLVKIDVPDFTTRKDVARIHAEKFGVDNLLKMLFALILKYFDIWAADKNNIPEAFLNELSEVHEPLKKRYKIESKHAEFLRDIYHFYNFVQESIVKEKDNSSDSVLANVKEHILKICEKYGVYSNDSMLPNLDDPVLSSCLLPMQTDIKSIFDMLEYHKDGKNYMEEHFFESLLNLIAEYTINFSNDDIKAVFQESSLEYYMEGQLVTPRYIGRKIGLIRKRKDERQANSQPTGRTR